MLMPGARITGSHEYEAWRRAARAALRRGLDPSRVEWVDPDDGQGVLFPGDGVTGGAGEGGAVAGVPSVFVQEARLALCHKDAAKWGVLYRVLWRLVHGERKLLENPVDDDVVALRGLTKGVRRDAHKMKAFVRFRKVEEPLGGERYVAYHEPEHRVVELVAPFFARRFGVMRWTILTPFGSVTWDAGGLQYGPAATRREGARMDGLEELWKTYYASVFNPARANERAMVREMPRKYWSTLPEAGLIDELLSGAASRTRSMTGGGGLSARAFIPTLEVRDAALALPVLREAAAGCRGCELHSCATRVVFGEGPPDARMMLVGEQPGEVEDVEGRPFVGPAGEVLARAMVEAGVDRSACYLTNAVKHFKWTPDPRGKRRIHARPSVGEVRACKAWLEEEIGLVRPDVIVLLGSTAVASLLGGGTKLGSVLGRVLRETAFAPAVVPTYHPSAVLRAPSEEARGATFRQLMEDLRVAAGLLERV